MRWANTGHTTATVLAHSMDKCAKAESRDAIFFRIGEGKAVYVARVTLAAFSPLGPCWHSNSTDSPSFRVL